MQFTLRSTMCLVVFVCSSMAIFSNMTSSDWALASVWCVSLSSLVLLEYMLNRDNQLNNPLIIPYILAVMGILIVFSWIIQD